MTRARCTALHAAYSNYAPAITNPVMGFENLFNPAPADDDALGTCILHNPCVAPPGTPLSYGASTCPNGAVLPEARDTATDYVTLAATTNAGVCSIAGQNTVVHCLCEASPPSAACRRRRRR